MRQSRRANSMLRRAALSALLGMPLYQNTPEDKGGAPPKEKKDEPPADESKISLSPAELEQRTKDAVKAALDKERDAQQKAKAKDDEERQQREAEEQGKFKELADKEREKREAAEKDRDALKLVIRKKDVEDEIVSYLAEKHPDVPAAAKKYIIGNVAFDLTTDAAEITKRIKASSDDFVKDIPAKPKGASGAPLPPGSSGGNRTSAPSKPNTPARAYSVAGNTF